MVRVAFLHPDLGIGGAERAVIDIALALKSSGHRVSFFTAHHDKSHCFPETTDGTLSVTTVGDWLPRSIFGRCFALCAYIRMIFIAFFIVLNGSVKLDLIFCDQVSACIPIIKMFKPKLKLLFYCHYPDMLLTTRQTFLKKLYRAPIDFIEEKSTGMAHRILVNSHFTASVFKETFKSLRDLNPRVLYPIIDFSIYDAPVDSSVLDGLVPRDTKTLFLSLNRFTRAKNHALALYALEHLATNVDLGRARVHLVITGGYDDRVRENIQTYSELAELCRSLALDDHVTFVKSCDNEVKVALMKRCTCLLYTPDREHFGITPLEAMYNRRPVIAVNSGGPRETILNGSTGFLREPHAEPFAEAMRRFVVEDDEEGLAETMGKAGYERVVTVFSRETFERDVVRIVEDLANSR